MDYTKTNKAAWEDAFEHRTPGWGDNMVQRLTTEHLPFLHEDIVRQVEGMDFTGKHIAQFCCNNGRELMALMQLGAASGTGFDIAENILNQGREAAKQLNLNCEFVCGNILEVGEEYHQRFDCIMFTIGALTWIQDLPALMDIVAVCLKPGGTLLIHDYHAFMNMLPLPGEEGYDADNRNKIAYPYFRSYPWEDANGMDYISGDYPSKPFTSFAHTTAAILTAVLNAGLTLRQYTEFDHDVGLGDIYDGLGYPLSYLLVSEK